MMRSIRLRLIALIAMCFFLIAAFLSGFFYGRLSAQKASLQQAVEAFQKRETIDHEISNLNAVDLCIALGGMSDQCTAVLQRLEKTTENQ
ncbi:hypothetical protein [Bartonella tamiae]|uniref:hypothetical protein n=1 Tax=Bartonella tamiae TaxID=373638 RepID=UPI00026E779D|nr:hypothetical protein [Bartonella tamiae]EJF92636.1 hypothetical protein MEG_01806 [Bartonella tamiae Th307]